MSNMPNFYVYCREYYAVYEPAEGGYYVSASKVDYEKHYDLEAAYECLLEYIMVAIEDGHEIHRGSWYCGFDTIDGETYLKFPWFEFDYTGYIGDGFELGITTDKPEDKPYMGYC